MIFPILQVLEHNLSVSIMFIYIYIAELVPIIKIINFFDRDLSMIDIV
jgi:hypothetical protein